MNGLLEILTNKFWMIEPDAAHAIRRAMEKNLNSHSAVGPFSKKASFAVTSSGDIKEYIVTDEGQTLSNYWVSSIKEPFVNVMVVGGPITRNGDACSYGSIDHRDMVMNAADRKQCRGHVFLIDTPGGSAWAKNDYQQCIEYARSKGQPVYAFIDGMCASAGMYLAALCDQRFYMHPKDQIGSIGVLCAFYSEKDGEKNAYTNETYHEIYEPDSYDKNKWYRDIVNEGDSKELVDELIALATEFRADVKKACPNAGDEHLHGKLFDAASVQGVLVDAQSTLAEVISLCFDTYEKNHSTSNNSSMDEKYQPLAAACGVEELVMTEEGTHLAMPLVDKLTEKLAADADAISAAEQQIADIKAANETAVAQLKDEHEKALADQKAKSDADIADIKAANATLTEEAQKAAQLQADYDQAKVDLADAQTQLSDTKAALAQAQTDLANAQQTIADRDEQIRELTNQAAETPDPSPSSNGTGANAQSDDMLPAYNPSLSPEENARIREQWKQDHGF